MRYRELFESRAKGITISDEELAGFINQNYPAWVKEKMFLLRETPNDVGEVAFGDSSPAYLVRPNKLADLFKKGLLKDNEDNNNETF